jgi:hypothetical protein
VLDPFTLIYNIEKYSKESMIETFNKSVRRLRGLLAGTTYALDSTIIETKSDFPGCGMTKREKEDSKGESSKVIYGFKLFILYEVKSRIIIAMDIVPANESDSKYFLSMVKKGVKNIGKGRIKLVIADRGFLDGSQMWELKNKLGIDFIIPAKSNMIVREDAIKLRNIYEKNNINTGNWKYGKYACKGYGVEGLLSYFEYNPTGIKDNKKTNGSPVNAVVVTTWKGKPVALGKEKVLLTSLPVNVPEMVAGGYRQRSLIENCGFRELKQASFLKCLPRRTGETAKNAAYLHIILCVFAHTLFYAFLRWRNKQKGRNSSEGNDIVCKRKWRREESINGRKTILIISEDKYYALFDIGEVLDILGVEQKYRIQLKE